MHAGRIALVLAWLGGWASLAPAQEGEGRRYALLIGVKDYDKRELIPVRHAEKDVDGLAEVLKRRGFAAVNVEVMTQTTGAVNPRFLPLAEHIRKRLALLMQGRRKDDVILVAFSGHGVQFRGEDVPYFCPLDAKLDRRETLISLREVYDQLAKSDAGLKLLMSDACRNDPAAQVARELKQIDLDSVSRPQEVEVPGGVAAFFSCAAGQQAFADNELGHGVFFHYLIQALDDPRLPIGQTDLTLAMLEDRVKGDVQDYVRRELEQLQTPDFESKIVGRPALIRFGDVVAAFAGTRAGEVRSDDNTLGIAFCWCPPTGPGGFRMGSPADEADRNHNEDQVTVRLTRGFWLGKTEVTQAQWRQVMGDNPSHFASGGGGSDEVRGMDTRAFPVERVSWEQAVAFCRKLTEREHAAGKLPEDWEIRLPTEAEWEYACRAGTTTATAFGDSLSSRQANFFGEFPYNGASKGPDLGRTAAVGSYAANAWNLHDMHGNVWEWCLDAYQDQLPGGIDPLVQLQGNAPRVRRGGSWSSNGQDCRSAFRYRNVPASRYQYFGFRLTRALRVQ